MPEPGAGEVRVRLHTSAVNPSDVKKRAGAQPAGFENGFVIPHSDGAGVIDAVGENVPGQRRGQRVWVYQAQFARKLAVPPHSMSRCHPRLAPVLPDNTGFDVGACIGIPMMTAHRCVHNAGNFIRQVRSGDRSFRAGGLLCGAMGETGRRLCDRDRGEAMPVAGLPGQTGADKVLNYRQDHLIDEIHRITGGAGVDHIVDVEFGVNAKTSAALLKNNGSISTYSSSLSPEPTIPFYPLMFKNISVNMVLVYNMPDQAKQQAIKDIYHALDRTG